MHLCRRTRPSVWAESSLWKSKVINFSAEQELIIIIIIIIITLLILGVVESSIGHVPITTQTFILTE